MSINDIKKHVEDLEEDEMSYIKFNTHEEICELKINKVIDGHLMFSENSPFLEKVYDINNFTMFYTTKSDNEWLWNYSDMMKDVPDDVLEGFMENFNVVGDFECGISYYG